MRFGRLGDRSEPMDGFDTGSLAASFIVPSHAHLPMLRLFLPATRADDTAVRWSELFGDLRADTDWREQSLRTGMDERAVFAPVGDLDAHTLTALRGLVTGRSMTLLRWPGYVDGEPDGRFSVGGNGGYNRRAMHGGDLALRRNVPEFAWDDAGTLAWGARLYPDSLVIAAEPTLFRRLNDDPTLDVVSIRADRDVLPFSGGD